MRSVERGSDPMTPADAASVLQWWSEAGVDTLVEEAPRDWLRPKATAPVVEAAPAAAEAPAGEWPGQLDLFHAWLSSSDDIPLASPAAPRICPAGDPASG